MLTTIAIENYRSLRDLRLPLARLNVVTGQTAQASPISIAPSGCSPTAPPVE